MFMWYITPLAMFLFVALLYPSTASHIRHLITRYSNVGNTSYIDMYSEWYAAGSGEGDLDIWKNTNPGFWVREIHYLHLI